ncbi:MAG: hypothetical protein RL549_94 [Verrucomicrobiota bacterium]
MEPGQSLLNSVTGSGEESPDTKGYFALGNRGRFWGDPRPTDSVTENRPPDIVWTLTGRAMPGKGETVG